MAAEILRLVTFVLCVGLGAAGYFVAHFGRLYFEAKKSRDFTSWQYEIDRDVTELIQARLHVAACEMRCAALLRNLPTEFVPQVFIAARIGYAVERTVLLEAERRGLYDPKVEGPIPPAVPDAEPVTLPPSSSRSLPDSVWKDGKLVPGGNT